MTIKPDQEFISKLVTPVNPTDPRWPIALTFSDIYWYDKTTHAAAANPNFNFLTLMGKTARALLIEVDQNITMRINATTNPAITVEAGRPLAFDDFYIKEIFITNPAITVIEITTTG